MLNVIQNKQNKILHIFYSQINVIPLSSNSKDWILKMDEFEEIILIANSEQLVCFAMSNYIVRICSIFGNQRAVVSIPGPLVSMSAFNNVLMVAYHISGVRDEDQCINIRLIILEGAIDALFILSFRLIITNYRNGGGE